MIQVVRSLMLALLFALPLVGCASTETVKTTPEPVTVTDRMRSEASFAALAGTSPVDASSGKQRRHRLNRGGDRQLNWALHVVALSRIRHHAETGAYYQRLLTAGKTSREARRCVKRALARHFYRRLREMSIPLTNIEASVLPCRAGR
jgi:transposase